MNHQLTIEQIEQLNQISDPVARRRYGILFQLPQDLQDTFVSEDTTHSVWNIAKEKYNLSVRNVGAVARIIGLIFLGELPIGNFIAALHRDLNVDVKTAQAIAQDINMAIFQPVRESLMAIHNINSDPSASSGQARNDADNNQNTKYEKGQTLGIPVLRSDLENSNSQNSTLRPPSAPVRPNVSGEAQRRRDEVLDKIRNQPPAPARPAMLRIIPNKNVVDLRVLAKKKHNKKSEYDGFFSA